MRHTSINRCVLRKNNRSNMAHCLINRFSVDWGIVQSFHLSVVQLYDRPRPWRLGRLKKIAQKVVPRTVSRKKKLHGKAAVHQSCMVETCRGGAPFRSKRALPPCVDVDIIVTPRTTFYNSCTLVFRTYIGCAVHCGPDISKCAVGDKTTIAHTASTCLVTEQACTTHKGSDG